MDAVGVGIKGGSDSLVNKIEKGNPGYVHTLYRRVVDVKGGNSSFLEIVGQTNALSLRNSSPISSIDCNLRQVNAWFNDNGGK